MYIDRMLHRAYICIFIYIMNVYIFYSLHRRLFLVTYRRFYITDCFENLTLIPVGYTESQVYPSWVSLSLVWAWKYQFYNVSLSLSLLLSDTTQELLALLLHVKNRRSWRQNETNVRTIKGLPSSLDAVCSYAYVFRIYAYMITHVMMIFFVTQT